MEALARIFFNSDFASLLLFLSVLLLAYQYQQKFCEKNRPPGPAGLSLLGVLPQMLLKQHYLIYTAWAEKYGDVVTVLMGGYRLVVLSSIQVIREAFVKNAHATSDRLQNFLTEEIFKNGGITASNGRFWKEHRRFALRTLRDFGMGKIRLEESILDEARYLCEAIEATNGEPFDIRHVVTPSVCNVIISIVLGKRFDHGDPTLHKYIGHSQGILGDLAKRQFLLTMCPWLRYLPGDAFGYKKVMRNLDKFEKGMQNEIDEHMRTHDPDVTRDYIDAYITKMKDEDCDTRSLFTEQQLLTLVSEFFLTGTLTTSSTLRWAILYMLHYPDVQDKLRKCIEENVEGPLPCIADRKNLVYLDATLYEALRLANLGSDALPRLTSHPVTIGGYHIPAKTILIPNMWTVQMNPSTWPNPEKFDPYRYIDAKGKLFIPDSLVPFFLGSRSCPGEALARMEMYLFLGSLMKRFRFEPETPGVLPPIEGEIGVVREPLPYMVRAIKIS